MNIEEMADRLNEKKRLMDTDYFLQKLKEFIDSEAYALAAPPGSLLIRGARISIDAKAAYLVDPATMSLNRIWSGWEQFPAVAMIVLAVIHKHGISNISDLTYLGITGEYAEFRFNYIVG